MALVTFTLKDFRLESLADRQPQVFFVPSAPATSSGYLLSATPIGPVPLAPNGTGEVNLVPTTVMLQKDIYYSMRIRLLGATDGESTWVDFPDWKLYVPVWGGGLTDLIQTPMNPSMLWSGTAAPDFSVAAGTMWFNPMTGDVKRWDGMSWGQVANITGPVGPRGPQGVQGQPGTNGVATDAAVATNASTRGTQTDLALTEREPLFASRVPTYAGSSRPHSYDRALGLYNGESAHLTLSRTRIARALRGESRCRVAFVGDSRTRGAGLATWGDQQDWGTSSLPAQVRDMIGAREGEIYFDPKDLRVTAISGFTFGPFENNQITTSGTDGSSVTIALPGPSTGFDLWMFRTGTTAVASISVDGGAPEAFAPGSGASWKRFEKRGLPSSSHIVTVTIPPLSAGSFTLSRIAPYYGSTGLTVTNAGRSSSHAAHWDSNVWNTLLPTLLDPNGYAPDVVIMNLGTNWMTSTYANFQSIVSKLTTAGAYVLLAGFGPRQEDTTDPVFNTRRGLMYDLADEFKLPLLDHLQIIGPWAVANARGLFKDTVHETLEGLSLEAAGTSRMLSI